MIVNIALQKPEQKQQKKSHQNFIFQFWIGEIEYGLKFKGHKLCPEITP